MGQLTGAVKQSSGNTQLAGMSWLYDQIGNRTSATENNVTTSYISNLVNQYTQIASQLPTYDADGNMLTCNGWTFTWNGENRLIAAESSDTRLEFSYDYMGRRLEKKVYTKGLFTLYDWSLVKHHKFVYDGYKLIAEFDVLDADAQPVSYLWQPVGLDVPLMRTTNEVNGYYVADGNKNILAVRDSNGTALSNYTYTPFGTVENPEDSDDNPFRFSSEYCDDETGLVYYNYRYYSPEFGRWIKRDPIEEKGGENLYGACQNNFISKYDALGKYTLEQALTTYFFESYNLSVSKYNPQQPINDYNSWKAKLSEQDVFDIWIAIESRDMSWTNALPKCPPCLPKRNGKFQSPYPDIWEEPTGVTKPEVFHPGAVWEIRTLKATASGAGNQCTYDKNGKVIKTRYGCGTADRMQATRNWFSVTANWWKDSGHIGHDVTPFNLAYKLDNNKHGSNVSRYVDVRPFIGE